MHMPCVVHQTDVCKDAGIPSWCSGSLHIQNIWLFLSRKPFQKSAQSVD